MMAQMLAVKTAGLMAGTSDLKAEMRVEKTACSMAVKKAEMMAEMWDS